MTEYTTSSQAYREYMTSSERTAYWVQSHEDVDFYSPTVPITDLDGWEPSSPISEAESSHSLPPRMVLRWGHGKPDVPIPYNGEYERPGRLDRGYDMNGPRSPRSPTTSTTSSNIYHGRGRSGSHPMTHSGPQRYNYTPERSPPAPEEIRILPSRLPPSSSNQPRSKSLPRSADLPSQGTFGLPGPMPNAPHTRVPYPSGPSQGPPQSWHPYPQKHLPNRKQPPAIVYAPSHTATRPHYAPPAIFHHPPQMGPDGMIYSHSAPVRMSHYSNGSALPSTMVPPSHTLARNHNHDQRSGTWSGRGSKTARGRSLSLVPPPLSPSTSTSSVESGSTYYVLPSAGQKVHVISPSPQGSIGATSTTRSPTSAQSSKRPFFQRLFSFTGRFSTVRSSKTHSEASSGRRLQRRHSTGGAGPRPEVNRH